MAGLPDFDAQQLQSPAFAQAWGGVQSQLLAEGNAVGSSAVANAKISMINAFEGMQSSNPGLQNIEQYAANYTMLGTTVLGAVGHVQGLISAVASGNPVTICNAFTGAMVGALIATDAVTVGTGALITAAVGVAVEVLEAVGILGGTPGTKLCASGPSLSVAPTISVGCVGGYATMIQNGSPLWRRFPENGGLNQGDSQWYSGATIVPFVESVVQWAGAPRGSLDNWVGSPNYRLVDSAWPMWHYMMSAPVKVPQDFWQAFLTAWKANQEFALNGLKPQSDAQVLIALARVWNRSHSSSLTYDITYAPTTPYSTPTLSQIASGQFTFPSNATPYLNTIMQDLLSTISTTDPLLADKGNGPGATATAIRINIGPQLTPPIALAGTTIQTSAPASSATGAKTFAELVGGLTLAGVVYGYVVGRGVDYVFMSLWKGAKAAMGGAMDTGARENPVVRQRRSRRRGVRVRARRM